MSIAEPLTVLKNELVQKIVPEVIELLTLALQEGTPAHQVEEGLWDLMLRVGNRGMQALFDSHGTSTRRRLVDLRAVPATVRCHRSPWGAVRRFSAWLLTAKRSLSSRCKRRC